MDDQNNVNAGENVGGNEPSGSSAGPVIGVIVILVIIILAGLYFWGQRTNDDMRIEDTLNAINFQNESDELNTSEADLEATDIENLDSEMIAS